MNSVGTWGNTLSPWDQGISETILVFDTVVKGGATSFTRTDNTVTMKLSELLLHDVRELFYGNFPIVRNEPYHRVQIFVIQGFFPQLVGHVS